MTIPAPFPYFGGKRRIAPVIWQALGDPLHYIEPFAGSLAVLLARPGWEGKKTETINELNPYIANFWRATTCDPEAVAAYADWPVNEADLHARHAWLRAQAGFRERMLTDPAYYDAQIAGWWVWGLCAWIGHGWCETTAGPGAAQVPYLRTAGQGLHSASRQLPHLGNAGRGDVAASRQLPHLGDAGRGEHRAPRKVPHLTDAGSGEHRTRQDGGSLLGYFTALHARLRRVRVCCGDWTRVLGPGTLDWQRPAAVFLDPPYQTSGDLYGTADHATVAADVLAWAVAHWDDPGLRIALCGYADELPVPEHWRCLPWKAQAGYQSQTNGNSARERVWLSPACLPLLTSTQPDLFA